jgi:hypothetical protein
MTIRVPGMKPFEIVCRRLAFLASVFVLSANGREFPPYPIRPLHEYQVRQTKNEVSVCLESVADVGRQKQYLGVDLHAKHFLPLLIVVENASGGSVIVSRDQIELFSPLNQGSGTPAAAVMPSYSVAGQSFQAASLPAAFVGASLPALLIADKLIAITSEIRHNLIAKQFRTQTLAPGKSGFGFLYLPSSSIAGHPVLQLRALATGGNTNLVFVLPVPPEAN